MVSASRTTPVAAAISDTTFYVVQDRGRSGAEALETSKLEDIVPN